VRATVEAPYLTKRPPPCRPIFSGPIRYRHLRPSSIASTNRGTAKSAPSLPANPATPDMSVSFPDLENFDPTYGLRPEGLPTKSVFGGFSSLFTPNKGLADLAEEISEVDEYEDEITPANLEARPSRSSSGTEQSLRTPPSSDHPQHEEEEAPIYMKRPASDRQFSPSLMDGFHSSSPPNYNHTPESDPEIVLRPSLNNSIHQLSTLSHSNHTLSPYTRSLSHFTVRSVPPRGVGSSGPSTAVERQPAKARRKRTYRLGGQSKDPLTMDAEVLPPSPPVPPSEFDASDMDRYFRSHDDLVPRSLDVHVRRRQSYQPA